MNYYGIWFLLGRLLMVLAGALTIPAIVAFLRGGPSLHAFLWSIATAGLIGVILQYCFRQEGDFRFGRRDAFVLVTAAWITASVVGALPWIFTYGPSFAVDGIFESASGFTTTGATILTDIGKEPPGLILWRSMTHWLGGMGIIVLGIAILPKLAVGGMELLGAEAPGPIQEKLTPRIAQTAKALWGIYALITAVEALVLIGLGMTPFEAINHAFATMATGGFSTLDSSVGGFANPAIEVVVTLFMVIAGANFALHFHLMQGQPGPLLKDIEFRAYLGILSVGTVLVAVNLLAYDYYAGVFDALRLASFQVVSVVTTTGFASADFDAWPSFSRALLFLLMFVGGCSGSTGGSVKVVRIVIVFKAMVIQLKRLAQPHAVLPVRLGSQAIPDDIVGSVISFFALFLVIFAAGGLALSALGLDVVSAFSASAACLGNVGPGFNQVGAAQTYAPLNVGAKLILILQMIIGRLELYTMLVLLVIGRRGLTI